MQWTDCPLALCECVEGQCHGHRVRKPPLKHDRKSGANKARSLVEEEVRKEEERELGIADAMEELASEDPNLDPVEVEAADEDEPDAHPSTPPNTPVPALPSVPAELESSRTMMSTQETGDGDDAKHNSPGDDEPEGSEEEESEDSDHSSDPDDSDNEPISDTDEGDDSEIEDTALERKSSPAGPRSPGLTWSMDAFLGQCIESHFKAEFNPVVRTRKVTIFMRGERIKATLWRDRVFEACACVLRHLPGVHLDVIAKINEETTFTSAEILRHNNAENKSLRLWFQEPRPGEHRVRTNATLASMFELSAEVEIYDSMYTLLRTHGPLGDRKVLDGNGLLLESLAQAVRSVITRHENYKLWMERPTVVMHTLMHVVNQMHHDAVLTSTLQSAKDARQCFRHTGLHQFM